MQKIVEFTVKNDALHITLIQEERHELLALQEEPIDSALATIFEYQLCNGWSWVDPQQIGALTGSPLLSNDVEYDDHGNVTRIGCVFYFGNYALVSEIDELLKRGEVVYQCAK